LPSENWSETNFFFIVLEVGCQWYFTFFQKLCLLLTVDFRTRVSQEYWKLPNKVRVTIVRITLVKVTLVKVTLERVTLVKVTLEKVN